MVDKIQKGVNKLNQKEKIRVKEILTQLRHGDTEGLSIKKLKGRSDVYRVRFQRIRILFQMKSSEEIYILAVERRSDTTYKKRTR